MGAGELAVLSVRGTVLCKEYFPQRDSPIPTVIGSDATGKIRTVKKQKEGYTQTRTKNEITEKADSRYVAVLSDKGIHKQ